MLQTVPYFFQQAMNCENAVLKGILTGLVVKNFFFFNLVIYKLNISS